MIEEAKGVQFIFGNEANYPEGTIGYRIAKDLQTATVQAKEALNKIS